MFKALLFLGLLSTACALRGMRTREETTSFLDMFDSAVEDREMQVTSPEALLEIEAPKSDPDGDSYGYYSPFDDSSNSKSSSSDSFDPNNYYYGSYGSSPASSSGSDDDSRSPIDPSSYPGIKDKNWQRPWNIVNGACSSTNKGEKSVIEIESVGGGTYYLGKIDIGTPAQPLNMILDTGSDEIVIKSSDCRGCKGYGYDMNKSSTSKLDKQGPNNGLSAFAYGSGPVVCQRVNDTVGLGQFKGDGMGIQMIVDTTISFFTEDDKGALHAIVGMAPGMQEYVGNTLASTMQVRTFSECLPKNTDENGFFVVNDDPGDIKHKQGFSGPFKSIGQYYWAASTTGLRLDWEGHTKEKYENKDKIPLYDLKKRIVAIVDTGTSLLSMPQTTMTKLHEAVGELKFDCSRMKELPKLKFEIEGVTHELAPEDYVAISDGSMGWEKIQEGAKTGVNNVAASMDRNSMEFKKLFFHKPGMPKFIDSETGKECMLLFTDPLDQTSPEGEMAILGMPFFRQYEISFDFCTKEMYTKRSPGDCAHKVGQHPTNVQFCNDKDWLSCWMEGFTQFFKSFVDGFLKIFSTDGEGDAHIDSHDRVAQKEKNSGKKQQKQIHGKPTLKIKPETIRLSNAAKMLLSANGQGGMISV